MPSNGGEGDVYRRGEVNEEIELLLNPQKLA